MMICVFVESLFVEEQSIVIFSGVTNNLFTINKQRGDTQVEIGFREGNLQWVHFDRILYSRLS